MVSMSKVRSWCCRAAVLAGTIFALALTPSQASAQVVGACCRPDGSCFTTNLISECTNLGGTFTAGANCQTLNCKGACCNPATGACTVISEIECRNFGGIFNGPGTTCAAPNPCTGTVTFACCLPNGNCFVTNLTSECAANNGTAQAPGSVCTPNPCPGGGTGLCCRPDGTIITTTQADCDAIGGVWTPAGTTPNCRRVCCVNSQCFLVTSAQECQAVGGTLTTFSTCSPNPCPPDPTGACCRGTTCAIATQAECLSIAGTIWLGAGTLCNPNPCPPQNGACCYVTATSGQAICTITTQSECTFLGGVWQASVSCQPSPCPELYGACCIRIPGTTIVTCVITTRGKCKTTPLAVWLGFGSSCTPNPCNPPPPEGACCRTDGSCTITTQKDCCGTWLGANVPCTTTTCRSGACCNPRTGDCVVTLESVCRRIGSGNFVLNGTCTPNPCPPPVGACCLGGAQCVITTQANCPPGRWRGALTLCTPNPCCRIDWNNDQLRSPADIFSFLNDYFVGCP